MWKIATRTGTVIATASTRDEAYSVQTALMFRDRIPLFVIHPSGQEPSGDTFAELLELEG